MSETTRGSKDASCGVGEQYITKEISEEETGKKV